MRLSPMKSLLAILPPALGVLALVASFALAVQARHFDAASIGLGAAGLALFLTMFARGRVRDLLPGVGAAIYVAFVAGTLVCAQILIERHSRPLDVTRAGRHTLSQGTLRMLELLRKEVSLVVLDTEDRPWRGLLDRYEAAGPRVRWTMIDPRADPLLARELDETVLPGTLYVRCGDRTKKLALEELDEKNLSNAIVDVTSERRPTVCFLEGHGEAPLEDDPKNPGASVAALAKFLTDRAMEVVRLPLADLGVVPRDAGLIVVVGPTRDVSAAEARRLEGFLEAGGRMLLFLDSPRRTGDTLPLPNLDKLLRARGLADTGSLAVDVQGRKEYDHPLKVPVRWYNPEHPITATMERERRGEIVMALARVFAAVEAPKGFEVKPLIASSPDAWTERFENLGRNVQPPTKLERRPLGWAIKGPPERPQRIVVFGASAIATDAGLLASEGAALLAINAVDWLTEREDLIATAPKVAQGKPMVPSPGELRLVLVWIAIVLPSLVMFGGVAYARLSRMR